MKLKKFKVKHGLALIPIVILVVVMVLINNKQSDNDIDASETYWSNIRPGAELERYYAVMGSLAVSSIELQPRENYQVLVEDETLDDANRYILKSDKYKHKVWYPNNVAETGVEYPLVVIVNDLNKTYKDYESYFEHLASWGFIVIGNDDMNAISGESSIESLNYALYLNSNEASILYSRINTSKIGISGRTQGGVGAINAVTKFNDSHYFTSLVTLSVLSIQSSIDVGWLYDVSRINAHYLSLAGSKETDKEFIREENLSEIFEYCNITSKNCTVIGQIKDTDRDNIIDESDAYQTAWFLMTLKGDKRASEVFTRDYPEIISNRKFENVRIKNAVVYNRT